MNMFAKTYRCAACGHELQDLGGAVPATCPNCGKQKLVEGKLLLWVILVCVILGFFGAIAFGLAFGAM